MPDAIAYMIFAAALAMLGFTAFHEAQRQQAWSTKTRWLVILCPLGMLVLVLFAVQHLMGEPNSLAAFDWLLILAFFGLTAWGLIAEVRHPAS
jgi:CDP-diglyceride synthetase